MAQSTSDDSAAHYVFQVLCMMFHIMD